MRSVARFVGRFVRIPAVCYWLVVLVALLPFAARISRADQGMTIAGSESSTVDRILRDEFASPLIHPLLLVADGLPSSGSAQWHMVIDSLFLPLVATSGVTAVISPANFLDTLLVSHDSGMALALVGTTSTSDAMIDTLRDRARIRALALRAVAPDIRVNVTGDAALMYDMRRITVEETHAAEFRALPIVLMALVWGFGWEGAIGAMLTVALVVGVSFGLLGLIGHWLRITASAQALVPMIGGSLTIDYVVYLVRQGPASNAAAKRTLGLAALIVMVAFGALAIAPIGEMRTVAPAGAIVVAVALIAAMTLTPAGVPRAVRIDRGWERWARWVTQYPVVVATLCVVPLAVLARHGLSARLSTPLEQLIPPQGDAAEGLRVMLMHGRGSLAATVPVLVTMPPGTAVFDSTGWNVLRTARERLERAPSVANVRSIETIGTRDRVVASLVFPASLRQALVSRDNRTALLTLIPHERGGSAAASALVRWIRHEPPEAITGISGARVMSGGLAATIDDFQGALAGALPWIVAVMAATTLCMLTAVLRTPGLALKAVLLNLLVAGASLGATVLVFQDGMISSARASGGLFPLGVVIAFGAVFGVSMDYELFLLSGVIQAQRRGLNTREAVVHGVREAGPVITRGAVVMVALFASFAASSLAPLSMLGFMLAFAITLDATVIRLALAPAVIQLLGRYNWWPQAELAPDRE